MCGQGIDVGANSMGRKLRLFSDYVVDLYLIFVTSQAACIRQLNGSYISVHISSNLSTTIELQIQLNTLEVETRSDVFKIAVCLSRHLDLTVGIRYFCMSAPQI